MSMEKVILGKNAIYSVDCEETGINNNVLVCGGSGCGKTMSISEPRLLETVHSNLIVTVTKRRIVEKYTPLLEERGYKVLDLNLAAPQRGNVIYDPLRYVKSEADVLFLAKSIVEANPRKANSSGDPYWDAAAETLLAAEIACVLADNEKYKDAIREGRRREKTFEDVLSLNDELQFERKERGGIETTVDHHFERVKETKWGSFAITNWKSFQTLPSNTAGCVYGVLGAAVSTMFSPELRQSFRQKDSVNFEEMAGRRTVLFITSSAVNPALHQFVNMLYAQVFKSLFEYAEASPTGALPIPTHVLCDDFATGGRILNFPEYISIFREKGISVTLLVQSESQLESMYGDTDATTIINNCDTYLYMGGMDLKTGRSVSQRMNIPLDEVLYMPIGKEFIFRRGERPLVTERYNIREDERYRKLSQPAENQEAAEREA